MFNYKRCSDAEKFILNGMVLIKDHDIPSRNKWKRGVIDDLIKGCDGKVMILIKNLFRLYLDDRDAFMRDL